MFIQDQTHNNLDSRYGLYINNRFSDSNDFPNQLLDIITGFEHDPDDCVIVYQKYIDSKWVYLYTVEFTV